MSEFVCNETGFSMVFSNGIRISVQFGQGNYCDNKNKTLTNFNRVTSTTAEIASMPVNGHGEWFQFVTYGIANDVKGWLTTDEVAGWIEIVSNAKSFAELKERQELIQHIMSKMNQVRGEEE